jgi:Kef-type K+ transport system membrane component KefB
MNRKVALAVAADIVCILLFVFIGRRNHNESTSSLRDIVEVAAPFLIALALGWTVQRLWTRPLRVQRGIILWLITVAFGLILRHSMFDRGIALPFIIVATLFNGVTLVGWRLLANRVINRRATSAT